MYSHGFMAFAGAGGMIASLATRITQLSVPVRGDYAFMDPRAEALVLIGATELTRSRENAALFGELSNPLN